jgi:1-acyl-sn-glycerol-3-phosphate acyltransferase
VIRTVWYVIVLLTSSLVHGVGAVVAGWLRVRHRPGGVYDWATVGWSRWILWGAGTPVRTTGLEHVPRGTPVVYAANHSSMFDIWALAAVLPGSVRFVAKQDLRRVPVIGAAMVRAGHVLIDRSVKSRALEAYASAAAQIHRGVSAIVFPEGTRSRSGELLPFKNAPFALAIVAQVPVIPVYVHRTCEILPAGAWRLRPQPIDVVVGPPIATAGLGPEDRQRVRDLTRAAIEALGARVDAVAPPS